MVRSTRLLGRFLGCIGRDMGGGVNGRGLVGTSVEALTFGNGGGVVGPSIDGGQLAWGGGGGIGGKEKFSLA